MSGTVRAVDRRTVHVWDGVVLFWAVLWTTLGVLTGVTLWQAADAGDSISTSGRALTSVGQTLQDLAALPLVPDRPGEIGTQIEASGTDLTSRGQDVKNQLHLLALLLGIATVGIPVTPVVGVYLPFRLQRRREVRGLRRALTRPSAALDELLADRARALLPYDVVVALLAEGEELGDPSPHRRLADAELDRIGLARPTED